MIGMGWTRFLLLDALRRARVDRGVRRAGYVLHDEIERIAEAAALTGSWLLAIFAAVVAVFVVVKVVRRQLFLRRLRIARVTPAELHALLAGAAPPFVVDLRHPETFARDPHTVPGALRLTTDQIEERHVEIPRDRDVVLYCT
jgi:hypothetical protein